MAKLLARCADQLQPALQLLSSSKFYWSVDRSQVSTLLQLLNNPSQQLHEPIRLGIITLLLIKFPQELTLQDYKALSQELVKLLKSSNYKKVVAALLLRLPNYTSYKQVLPYLQPKLTPLSRMLHLSSKLKQSSSTLFQKQLSKYRVQWCCLSSTSDLNLSPLQSSYNLLSNPANLQNLDGVQLQSNLQTQTNYLLERISVLGSQRIDFNKICTILEKLIAGVAYQVSQVREEWREAVGRFREQLKVTGLMVLNEIVGKLRRRVIRKYVWVVLVLEYCVSSPSSVKFVLLSLQLMRNILEVFGNGALKLKEMLFTAEHSLFNLLTYLFRRKPVSNLKEQMQFRRDKHPGRPKQQDKPTLDLNEPNKIFQQALSTATKHDQSQIILKIFEIFRIYYSKPHESTCQNTAQLLELIDLHESKLSPMAVEIYKEIKNLIMPQNVVFSGDVDGIYEEMWAERAKRKKMRQGIVKTLEVQVRCEGKDKMGKPVLKRAVSEDLSPEPHPEIEGWGTPTKNKPEQPKAKGDSEPSEMFYSFHDSRFSRNNLQTSNLSNKPPPPAPAPDPNADDFILTPSFQ